MAGGLGNINTSDIMKGYMDIFNNNVKSIKTPEDFNTPETEGLLKGYITKNQLAEDPELASDLNALTKVNQINTLDNGISGLSADKAMKSFSNVMGDYINDVNMKQKDAEKAVEIFSSGGNIDIHSVMIASEKANLSMQLTMQMRSKILQAYQEISRMQV